METPVNKPRSISSERSEGTNLLRECKLPPGISDASNMSSVDLDREMMPCDGIAMSLAT
jgi:hypothetical protein